MMRLLRRGLIVAVCVLTLAPHARAADLTADIQRATSKGPGESLGSVTVSGSDAGARFRLALHGLPPGQHGFHVHENGECGPTLMNGVRIPAGAAGEDWDPDLTGKHAGPTGDGRLGDLPVIEVGADGTATQTLTAPRIKDIERLRGRSLVIQTGGDNYSDDPIPGGGGGLRLACGALQ
jgi:Cu-Zn family superoxide dismutase